MPTRSLAEQLAALSPKVDVNLRASFLPRGSNSATRSISPRVEGSKISTPRAKGSNQKPFNMKDHYMIQPETRLPQELQSASPEYVEAVWRNQVGLPHTVVSEAIKHAQSAQAVSNHAAQMEAHTMMTKGALHPFKTLEQLGDDNKPDRATTWDRANHKVDVNLKLARLRALRAESDRITNLMGE